MQSTKGGLDELRQTRGDLLCARLSALQAQVSLSGAREKRARELTEMIADALTHVGQIAMLRRLAGCPIKGENYYQADIATGRVGPDQVAPRREF